MSLILIVSILIRLVAMGLSILLLRRLRDWRMGFLSVMLALMALRQTFTLLTETESWALSVNAQTTELPGLMVSIMALLAIFFLERMLTERKRAKEALLQSERVVQSLIAHAPYSIWVCNGKGTVVYANQAALDLFGVNDGTEIIGRYNIYRHTTEAEKQLLPCFERAWAGELVRYRQDLDMTTVKYGTSRHETLYFYSTLFAIPVPGAPRPNVVVIQEDVTEKVRAEEHIQHLQSVLKAIRNINQLIVHEKNRQKLLQGACDILTQTRDYRLVWIGLVQEGTEDVVPAAQTGFEDGYLESLKTSWENSAARMWPMATVVKTKEPVVIRNITADPRYEPCKQEARMRGYSSSASVPMLHEKAVVGVLTVCATDPDAFDQEEIRLLLEVGQDIAFALYLLQLEEERRYAQEALRKAHEDLEARVAERTKELAQANIRLKEMDRLKSEFLATMSHELRTPLNSIIGFTGITLQGIAGQINEEQRKQLSMVYGSAKHLLGLINDILDLSRIEAGKMEISTEEFKIQDVLSEVAHSLSPMISEKGLRLITEVPDDTPELLTDRGKLLQILVNLVHNAVKFTSEGQITIKCNVEDDHVKVTVADTGIGIKREDMDYLFEAFRQIDGTARRRYQGAGLGLYLCKQLVTLLGGEISAESEYGKGSKFAFILPLSFRERELYEETDIGGGRQ